MNDSSERIRHYAQQTERPFWPKSSYIFFGALGGVALGVFAFVLAHDIRGARGALLLAAGGLFGSIVGLDLHSTRRWRHFGSYTFPTRFILACSAGGTATGVIGMLLGVIARADLWKYTGGGAILGLAFLLWVKLAVDGR